MPKRGKTAGGLPDSVSEMLLNPPPERSGGLLAPHLSPQPDRHAGANLVVLPELCNSGYVFNTREEAYGLAEEIPGGATCQAWAEAAARHKMPIADANLSNARRKRCWNDFNQVFRDRRIDLYAEDLGAGIQRG